MKTYLEYQDDKSHKFWQIVVSDNEFTITYGKIGANGQSKTKSFDTSDKALSEANKLIKQKVKKGYSEVEAENNTQMSNAPINEDTIDYYTELVKFEKKYGGASFAQSFYIADEDEDFFDSWLSDMPDEKMKEYCDSMKIFANADGTGGHYAFWLTNGNTNYNKAPIISYGSEGDISIVAENIKDLIKMLSFGAEGMDGSFYHYIDDDNIDEEYDFYEEFLSYTPNHEKFREWMKTTLQIEPVSILGLKDGESESDEIEKMQKKAKRKLEKAFNTWQYQFYPSPEEESNKYREKQNTKYKKQKLELTNLLSSKPTPELYLELSKNENVPDEIDFKQRLQYLKDGHAAYPDNLDIILKIAKNSKHSEFDLAIEFYNKALNINPENSDIYSDIAYAYKNSDKKEYQEKALEFYIKDIIARPNSYGNYSQKYIIDICKNLKDKDALSILEDSLKLGDNKGTYKVLYEQYFKKKDYIKAAENAIKYIDSSTEQAHNFTRISDALFKKKAYKEAISVIKKALPRHTHDNRKMSLYNDLGLCYLHLEPKNIDKRLNVFLKAYKLDKNELAIHQNINLCGIKYLEINEVDKAIEIFQFCIDNNIEKSNAVCNLGVCYSHQGKHKEALPYFEEALKLDPENEQYKDNLALTHKELKLER